MNSPAAQLPERSQRKSQGNKLLQWISVLLLVYLLIVAVGVISRGFRSATGGRAEDLFALATNPFLGLILI